MSQLFLTGQNGYEFALNVTQFRSPMSSSINSVQTRTMLQHFPIRCGQPDIQFTVQFRSQNDKHKFQNFVREHMVKALDVSDTVANDVNLFWPERNIENWTGYITNYKVVERRFEYAPIVTFGVDLISSLMSEKTTVSSYGSPIENLYGQQIRPWNAVIDGILGLPSRALERARALGIDLGSNR